ncbi:MAG: hypothetical protein KKD31_11785 [Bacteroidetes bacterium]|nr:hypothetical protein [Bacteroidota bacterium]
MKNKGLFTGEWSSDTHTVRISLPLIFFLEDNANIVFCPALDISAAGLNEQDALQAFRESISEYLLYTTRKGTLAKDLAAYGWKVKKSRTRKMTPPDMSYLLQHNDEFNRVFNTCNYRKENHTLELPAIA